MHRIPAIRTNRTIDLIANHQREPSGIFVDCRSARIYVSHLFYINRAQQLCSIYFRPKFAIIPTTWKQCRTIVPVRRPRNSCSSCTTWPKCKSYVSTGTDRMPTDRPAPMMTWRPSSRQRPCRRRRCRWFSGRRDRQHRPASSRWRQ